MAGIIGLLNRQLLRHVTVFVYHEAHEDHEEFTGKLYRLLRFKPRGRYNLIYLAACRGHEARDHSMAIGAARL